jgi:hypothetical protein
MKNIKLKSVLIIIILSLHNIVYASNLLENQDIENRNALNEFKSTAQAMSIYYSYNKNTSINNIIIENPERMSLVDSNFSDPLFISKLNKDNLTLAQYKDLLDKSNIGLNIENSTLSKLQLDLYSKKNSIDSFIVKTGLEWSSRMNNLSFGDINSVKTPNTPELNNLGTDNLVFGLFLNQSIANFIGNYPDIFKVVSETGVVSNNANDAWRNAINTVGKNSGVVLKNIFTTDPCNSSYIDGITSQKYDGCSPCYISGSYSKKIINSSLTTNNNPINKLEEIKEFDFSQNNEFDFSNKTNCENNSNINNEIVTTLRNTITNINK